MLGIAVFVLALVAIFAVKAAAIMFTRDELVEESTAFCWTQVHEGDEEPVWLDEQDAFAPARMPVQVYGRRASVA